MHIMAAMGSVIDDLALLLERGGYVMLPLLVMSIVSLTLIVERAWFWSVSHRPARVKRLARLNDTFRRGDRASAAELVANDRSPYGEVARHLLDHGATAAVAVEAVESQRPRIDRFMATLSTIITAAPLLGILGTVIGLYFTPEIAGIVFVHLPWMMLVAIVAIALGGFGALVHTRFAGLDRPTAFFASVPGGLAEMSITAEVLGREPRPGGYAAGSDGPSPRARATNIDGVSLTLGLVTKKTNRYRFATAGAPPLPTPPGANGPWTPLIPNLAVADSSRHPSRRAKGRSSG